MSRHVAPAAKVALREAERLYRQAAAEFHNGRADLAEKSRAFAKASLLRAAIAQARRSVSAFLTAQQIADGENAARERCDEQDELAWEHALREVSA